ncbi:TPA: hypothetical protein H2X82_000112 [Salmonella enterica]|nr:hypothetical protein [Salmonella enterica]
MRFIPAGAGNTFAPQNAVPPLPVYPRWFERTRFIPAGAGNTDIGEYKRSKVAVYPRWRGEH